MIKFVRNNVERRILKMNSVFISNSPKNTREIAAQLATTLNGGEVIAFYGDLGQGKTCFVTGLAEGLGFTGEVSSPTFAIISPRPTRSPSAQ